MGRAPCCDKASVKRGPWSPEEDAKLKEFIDNYGTGGNWIALPQKAGLKRCGKSCRLRWLNYLRPNIKHGEFSEDEDRIICTLFATIGSRWSVIAAQLPGRTDNDIKNYWNTKLKKKLMSMVETSHLKNPQHDHDHDHHQPNNFSSFLHQPSPYNYNPATAAPRPSLDLESSSIYFIPQDQETFPTPMQNYQKTLMFDGGDQAISSSSSDGSQMDHHYNAYGYFNGVHGTHKLSPINGFGASEAATTTLDYGGLEEIKQLMSTNSSGNIGNNNVNNFLLPESRTAEERMLLYY